MGLYVSYLWTLRNYVFLLEISYNILNDFDIVLKLVRLIRISTKLIVKYV
jgi:hypothetical protein